MLTLRPYQQEAVDSIYQSLRDRDDNPCVVIPTGGGKTPVIATVCKDAVGTWNGRVLILAHVKELLEQAADKLNLVCPEINVGVYSAGLKRRDTNHPVIVAGIQSVYKRACELDSFDLIIVDEAHLIPPDGDGMYRKFLDDAKRVNPHVRVVGLTATPFRMKSGDICGPENILNHVSYEIGVRELIVGGYLSPLVTKASAEKVDTSGLHIRAGEFIASETEELMNTAGLVESACREIVGYCSDRKSCLIFATSVQHGHHIADVLRKSYHAEVGTVFGDTLSFVRDETLDNFRNGKLKYLVNVNVLTTGFDAPNIDCVAMVRPTMSPGLYYQMVGRGFRTHPDKENCLVLDFGGNVVRHGPVDSLHIESPIKGEGDAPVKECPACHSLIMAGFALCPDCGHVFPDPERQKHEARASSEGILTGQSTVAEYEVEEVTYSIHHKRGAPDDAPRSMRVEYQIGWRSYQSEWVCFEHFGFARRKAEEWWSRRSNAPVPDTTAEAVALAEEGALCETTGITVTSKAGEKFDKISSYELGAVPDWREPGWDDEEFSTPVDAMSDEDVPF